MPTSPHSNTFADRVGRPAPGELCESPSHEVSSSKGQGPPASQSRWKATPSGCWYSPELVSEMRRWVETEGVQRTSGQKFRGTLCGGVKSRMGMKN